jgi:hypothetical protein
MQVKASGGRTTADSYEDAATENATYANTETAEETSG